MPCASTRRARSTPRSVRFGPACSSRSTSCRASSTGPPCRSCACANRPPSKSRYSAVRRAAFLAGMSAIAAAAPAPATRAATNPEEKPRIIEFVLPRAHAFPHDPALAPDGMVWYADQATSHVGRLDPDTGAVVDVATPTPNAGPHGIAVAANGTVWFTENGAGRIGSIDPVHMT